MYVIVVGWRKCYIVVILHIYQFLSHELLTFKSIFKQFKNNTNTIENMFYKYNNYVCIIHSIKVISDFFRVYIPI